MKQPEVGMLKRLSKIRNGKEYEEMDGDTNAAAASQSNVSNVTSDDTSASGVSTAETQEGNQPPSP